MTELKIFQEYALNLVKSAAFRQQVQVRMAEEDGGGGPDLPVTETDITKNIPVCHSKIRTFEWTVQLEVRYRSHKKWASTTNGVHQGGEGDV